MANIVKIKPSTSGRCSCGKKPVLEVSIINTITKRTCNANLCIECTQLMEDKLHRQT